MFSVRRCHHDNGEWGRETTKLINYWQDLILDLILWWLFLLKFSKEIMNFFQWNFYVHRIRCAATHRRCLIIGVLIVNNKSHAGSHNVNAYITKQPIRAFADATTMFCVGAYITPFSDFPIVIPLSLSLLSNINSRWYYALLLFTYIYAQHFSYKTREASCIKYVIYFILLCRAFPSFRLYWFSGMYSCVSRFLFGFSGLWHCFMCPPLYMLKLEIKTSQTMRD